MNYLETAGFVFIVLTWAIGVATVAYFAGKGASITRRQCARGAIEETMSITRELEIREHVDEMQRKQA